LKLPELPPVAIVVQLPPPELDDELLLVEPVVELELLLDEELLDELVEPVVELDELELLELDELELLEVPPPPPIVPADGVNVTRSSREPSSRLLIRNV
jgi:8-oxo-dGTP pyrophosphatase MutT (NUDIX family)